MEQTQSSAQAAATGFDWRAFDAYLFDIDGTLLNSRDAVHYEAFLVALRERGCKNGIDGVPTQGSTDPIILLNALARVGIDEAAGRTMLAGILDKMSDEVELHIGEMKPELCAAVPQLLAELHASGKLLGVASGNVERIGWAKLKAAGIRQYFSFGSYSDRNETRTDIFRWGADEARRRIGTGARVCFVGDTPGDISAAKEAGFPVIAVATGIFSVAELAALDPELCIAGCESLFGCAR